MGRDGYVPVGPKPGSGGTPPSSGGGGGSSSSSSAGSSGYSGGSGGGGGDPYAYAKAQERKADREAREKWLGQVRTIQQQIDALRLALGPKGFKKRLEQQLKNIRLDQRQTEDLLREGYHERVGSLRDTADDNEKAAAGQTVANQVNRSRERSMALAEATAQGAGESDLLRAQQMSLSNWQANQAEVSRSYFDTLTSINSSLADLTVDTKTGLVNAAMGANQDRESVWNTYYDRRSETLTALGNALGQQAEYYGLANEAMGSKKLRKKQREAAQDSGRAFDRASTAAGGAYDDPGVPKRLRTWDGAADFEGKQNNAKFSGAATELAVAHPERATLRSW